MAFLPSPACGPCVQGLRACGLLDEASAVYLRLLEIHDGDAALQAAALRSCLACWADEHGQHTDTVGGGVLAGCMSVASVVRAWGLSVAHW
eukprot:362828-Chlamydomonas_euryale.AAC.2